MQNFKELEKKQKEFLSYSFEEKKEFFLWFYGELVKMYKWTEHESTFIEAKSIIESYPNNTESTEKLIKLHNDVLINKNIIDLKKISQSFISYMES